MTNDDVAATSTVVEVLSREPVTGGFSGAPKFRLEVAIHENGERVERMALLKQTSQTEVSALSAAAGVVGADAVPAVIDTGVNAHGPYILTAFYEGEPTQDETALPADAIATLAKVHAHFLTAPAPPHVPVVDGDWWRAKCDVSMQRLAELQRPVPDELRAQVGELQDEPKIIESLDRMRRSLIHGDVHRNNVLVDEDGRSHLIDWGGAFIGAPALDIANLGGPGSPGYQMYVTTWQSLTGEVLDENPAWQRSCLVATVWISIKYLAFATKIFGDEKGQVMIAKALNALDQI